MRKLLTVAAAALALGTAALASPALADQSTGRNDRGSGQSQENWSGQPGGHRGNHADRGDNERRYGGERGDYRDHGRGYDDSDRGYGRGVDLKRHERGFDEWERGWNRDGRHHYGRHAVLPYRVLVRRLARQGYFDVRGLRPSHWGFGWRAFAFTGRGRPVMLRINPYNGDVLAARRVGHRNVWY